MKRLLATIGITGALGFTLAAPGIADARVTRIISYWNGGNDVGTPHYVKHHPRKIGFVMAGTNYQGYWLVRHTHWRHWGHRRRTARGKLASADLAGTRVRIRARRHTYHSCRHPGDTVYFYTRAKIHIHGEHRWRRIPHNSLVPQCNNP